MFKVPEKYRIKTHPLLGSDESHGNNGAFDIPIEKGIKAFVIVSDGDGWEHVSIQVLVDGKSEIPTWEEMCIIKDTFWSEEDCVIQYHPPKSEYVNNHSNVLHLWRPTNINIPTPPSIMVGIK